MSTYAIGDVQGCATTLGRLVRRTGFSPERDRLWFVGDLVNRGASSLEVLRYVRGLGDRAVVVLGNHDLHLLARAAGVRRPRSRDTLDEVLAAPDREDLLDWLRSRPLLHREGERLLVHAGLLPGWSPDDATARAEEAMEAIRGPAGDGLLRQLDRPESAHSDGGGPLYALLAMTRMRACSRDGKILLGFEGGLEDVPEGHHPWFRVPGRRSADVSILFGHWSLLGLHRADGVCALDTGCVYGGALTALRLEDGTVFQEPCAGEDLR